MQSEFLGEHQLVRKSGSLESALTAIGVTRAEGESLKDFAKRARAALLMSASVSGTAELNPQGALTRMQSSKEYAKERADIEKKATELQKSLQSKAPNMTAEDANKLARSLSSSVLTYVATAGVGKVNADEVFRALNSAITTPKGSVLFLGVDMGIMAKVVEREKFKVSLGGGIGAGASSDGFFAFAHIDATGKLTLVDRSNLEDIKKSAGNTTLTLGASAGLDLQSFKAA